MFAFRYRLIPNVKPEDEWLYLVNETYVGERCIVPLLQGLADLPQVDGAFERMFLRQADEERGHVARYEQLLSSKPLSNSGFDVPFARYVEALPNVTLKLFALQAMLEGVSLGALEYRMSALAASPSARLDREIFADELRHTKFGFAFLRRLREEEGRLPKAAFAGVAHQINAIFAQHFRGECIARLVREQLATNDACARAIDESPGMRRFFSASTRAIIASKNQFLAAYERR